MIRNDKRNAKTGQFVSGVVQGGRPKGTKNKNANKLHAMLDKLAPSKKLIERQMELASGLFIEERTKDGLRRVYLTKPDREAGQFLLEMRHGKAIQQTRQVGDDGQTVPVLMIPVVSPSMPTSPVQVVQVVPKAKGKKDKGTKADEPTR